MLEWNLNFEITAYALCPKVLQDSTNQSLTLSKELVLQKQAILFENRLFP